MKSIIIKGTICLEDDYHFLYKIAKIEYEEYEDGNYKYSIFPNFAVIDLLPVKVFQGIPGLDLSLRREVYKRENMIPVFISERAPANNRENLWELLEENNMTTNNMLEWLIKTNTRYSGDRLFVTNFKENNIYNVISMYELVNRSNNIIKKLLQIITSGEYLVSKEVEINDSTRKMIYNLLMPIYISTCKLRKKQQRKGIKEAQVNNKYKGRKKKELDTLLFSKLKEDYINHKITAHNAAKRLGISRSTFIRRINCIK